MYQYQRTVQQYLAEMLLDKYDRNKTIIERIGHIVATEQDARDMIQLIQDSFARGFIMASDQYKSQLEKMGWAVHIK